MFDPTVLQNLRQRALNLQPDAPYSSLKAFLSHVVDVVRLESLETGVVETEEQRNERRIKVNEAKETLMSLLLDPAALYADYRERQSQEQAFANVEEVEKRRRIKEFIDGKDDNY